MLEKISNQYFYKINIEEINILGYKNFSKYAQFLSDNEMYFVHDNILYPQLILDKDGFISEKYWKDKKDNYLSRNGPSLITYAYNQDKNVIKKTLIWYKNKKNFRDFNKPSYIVKTLKEKEYHWTNEKGVSHRLKKPAIIKKDSLNNIILYSYYHKGLKGNIDYWLPTEYREGNFYYYKEGFDITKKIKKISLENDIDLLNLNKKEIDFLKINLN